jgi:hypothetical protein
MSLPVPHPAGHAYAHSNLGTMRNRRAEAQKGCWEAQGAGQVAKLKEVKGCSLVGGHPVTSSGLVGPLSRTRRV